jgi:hypothetical protein
MSREEVLQPVFVPRVSNSEQDGAGGEARRQYDSNATV